MNAVPFFCVNTGEVSDCKMMHLLMVKVCVESMSRMSREASARCAVFVFSEGLLQWCNTNGLFTNRNLYTLAHTHALACAHTHTHSCHMHINTWQSNTHACMHTASSHYGPDSLSHLAAGFGFTVASAGPHSQQTSTPHLLPASSRLPK